MTNWISVENELPKEGQKVLIVHKNEILISKYDLGRFYQLWNFRLVSEALPRGDLGRYFSNIYYWMPLPEPPNTK